MTYQVLARKWRPQTFDEIIAQPHIVRTLTNALKAGKIHHAFLFAGPRGTGKTTTARILAKALNCKDGPTPTPCGKCPACKEITGGSYMDVIEIDAASNTGVDDIRDLRESSHYVATGGKYKVYIIDEVHRLSGSAFDALLKTLEEPPAHVVFIFATTEAHKVPATIHSRCLKFDFRLIPYAPLAETLQKIAEAEKIDIEPAAIEIIAHKAAGSLRDGQSLLDQVSAYAVGRATAEIANEALGLVDNSLLFDLVDDFAAGDAGAAIARVSKVAEEGRDYGEFGVQLVEHLRNLLLVTALGEDTDLLDVPADRRELYKKQAAKFALGDLYRLVDYLRDFLGRLRWSTQPLLDAQMLAARAAKMDKTVEFSEVLGKIDDLLKQGPGETSGGTNLFDALPQTVSSPPAPSPTRSDSAAPRQTTARTPEIPSAPFHQKPVRQDDHPTVTGDLKDRILERIRKHSSVIAGFMTNAQITRGEGGAVDITVYGGNGYIQKQLAQKSNSNMIQAEVAAEMGQGLHVRLHVASESAPDRQTKTGPPRAEPSDDSLLQSDEKLRMIVEKFDAEIMPEGR
jgi:DNA polymerase-3 subunit gamma/tau